jgi:N-methylhydantoinase A
VRTHRGPLDAADARTLDALYAEMKAEAAVLLKAQEAALRVEHVADMRYRGQGYNVRVALGAAATDIADMRRRFEEEYKLHYGRVYPDVAIELVNLRLVARLPAPRPFAPARLARAAGGIDAARKGSRRAWFGAGTGYLECPVFDRYRLGAGHAHDGAAFVEERETTTLVGPGGGFEVNDYGMLVVHVDSHVPA